MISLGPTRSSSTGERRAFSLIELVVVMGIIGIVTVIAIPTMSGSSSHHRAEAARRRLMADLDLVRAQAGAASEHRGVRINAASESYEFMVPDDPSPRSVRRVGLSDPGIGAEIGGVALPDDDTIWFDGFGVAAAPAEVRVGTGRAWWRVTVDAGTGRLDAARADGASILVGNQD